MFLGMGVFFLLLAALPIHLVIRVILIVSGSIFTGLASYLSYVAHQFSAKNGSALDIGTGNGLLAIRIVKKYPAAQVTGIDYWGNDWKYAQNVFEKNVVIEGVSERTAFKRASASDLPFVDGQFDAVFSHFVFHEVADAPDKRDVIREALRVLNKGGAFAFQDMFLDKKLYGEPTDLVKTIRSWGVVSAKK